MDSTDLNEILNLLGFSVDQIDGGKKLSQNLKCLHVRLVMIEQHSCHGGRRLTWDHIIHHEQMWTIFLWCHIEDCVPMKQDANTKLEEIGQYFKLKRHIRKQLLPFVDPTKAQYWCSSFTLSAVSPFLPHQLTVILFYLSNISKLWCHHALVSPSRLCDIHTEGGALKGCNYYIFNWMFKLSIFHSATQDYRFFMNGF